jgi:nucleoid DNA-binding protein
MTKAELAKEVSREVGISQTDALLAVDATLKHMAKGTEKDGVLSIQGFGTFKTQMTKERMGKIPGTDKVVKINSRKVVKFKASKDFLGK